MSICSVGEIRTKHKQVVERDSNKSVYAMSPLAPYFCSLGELMCGNIRREKAMKEKSLGETEGVHVIGIE